MEGRGRSWAGLGAVRLATLALGCGRGRELPALHRAARQGDLATIAAQLKAGAAVDTPAGVNGWTPLQHAIHRRQASAARALLAAAGFGAIADITDGPPLGSCFPEVAEALLAKAPDWRLRWGTEARLTYWLARKDCKRLIDRLRER